MFKTLKLFPPFHGDEDNGCVVWKLSLHEVEKAIVQYESDDNVCVAYVDEVSTDLLFLLELFQQRKLENQKNYSQNHRFLLKNCFEFTSSTLFLLVSF